jgi:acyl-CoA reductase-like NAD-dependent aldehyde dehydrogenase
MNAPIYDKVLIAGAWEPAAHGTYQITNPATEEAAGFAPECSIEQVQRAARAARDAFERGAWPRLTANERGALLRKAAELFEREKASLVDLTMAETGALRFVAETQQVGAVGIRLAKYASLASAPAQEPLPPQALSGRQGTGLASGMAVREPVGVVACITPYNFPMTNCAGRSARRWRAARGGGEAGASRSARHRRARRMVDSILPPGVLNFVCGSAPEIGAALCESPDVDMVSFTGSTAVGQQIQATAARSMKRTLLELGGKSPNVIFADADRAKALASAMGVWTFHSGQICIAGTRVLVEASIYDEFTNQLAAAAARLKIGPPGQEGVAIGPLVSAAQRERVERYIARGVEEGATLACGGKVPAHLPRGYYVEPTFSITASQRR